MNATDLDSVSKCRLCPMLGKDHVPSVGLPTAQLMVVGQSPGAREVELGKPFVGPCGELLDLLLAEADLQRSEVYIANTLKCHPPGNRPGMDGEIRNCVKTWLAPEIQFVNPKVVLVLGKDAWKAVGSKKAFVHLEQNVHPKTKAIYLNCYHPSYLMRCGRFQEFIEVGRIVKDLLNELPT